MSREIWQERIDHILDAISAIEEAVEGCTFESFAADRMRLHAALWSFHVIGEAIKHIPEHIRDSHPEVPWRRARSMRNLIVHDYGAIDIDIVWEAATCHIGPLREQLLVLRG